MLLAAYVVAGFTVAGVYAVGMLRGRRDRYHRIGLLMPLTVGAVAIPLQIVMGDVIARYVFTSEPAKFAAIEALPDTRTHAPETLGGVLVDGKVKYGVPIPDGASLLSGLQPGHQGEGAGRDPAGRAAAGPAGHHRPPVLRRDGRHRLRAVRAGAVVRLVLVAIARRRAEPLVPARGRGQRRRLDRVARVPAGSSPRSAGSPGRSSGCCSPATPCRPPATSGRSSAAPCSSTPASRSARSTPCARCGAAGPLARRPACRTGPRATRHDGRGSVDAS